MTDSTSTPERRRSRAAFMVDSRLAINPDVLQVSPRALGYWVRAGSWSAHHRTQGFIPHDARIFTGPWHTKALHELEDAGLLEALPNGWQLDHGNHGTYDLFYFIAGDYRAKIPQSVRDMVYARDGHACVTCGATENLTLDHIYPWSLGGSDHPDNLQTMCRPHNIEKGARVA